MNSTNRGLNRFLICVVGLVFVAAGAGALLIALVPDFSTQWKNTAPEVSGNISRVLVDTPLAGTGSSWLWLVAVVVLVIIAALLIAFIFRQGRGRTRQLIRHPESGPVTTVVDSALAEQLLTEALSDHPQLVSANVSTFRVRGTPVVKVSVTCRRGVSPAEVTKLVDERLRAMDTLLGEEIPTLIEISGGFRARASQATRLN